MAGILNSGCILRRLLKEGERYCSWFSEGIGFGIVKSNSLLGGAGVESERSILCISARKVRGGSVELGEGTGAALFLSVRKASRRWYRMARSVKGEASTDCCVARLATGEGVAPISDRITKSWDSN